MPISVDYQVEINALLMGPDTSFPIVKVSGLDQPPIISNDVPRGGGDGSVPGIDTLGPRIVTIECEVFGATASDMGTNMSSLLSAWTRSNVTVTLAIRPGGRATRYLFGRPRRTSFTVDRAYEAGLCPAVVEFEAHNPHFYDAASGGSVVVF